MNIRYKMGLFSGDHDFIPQSGTLYPSGFDLCVHLQRVLIHGYQVAGQRHPCRTLQYFAIQTEYATMARTYKFPEIGLENQSATLVRADAAKCNKGSGKITIRNPDHGNIILLDRVPLTYEVVRKIDRDQGRTSLSLALSLPLPFLLTGRMKWVGARFDTATQTTRANCHRGGAKTGNESSSLHRGLKITKTFSLITKLLENRCLAVGMGYPGTSYFDSGGDNSLQVFM